VSALSLPSGYHRDLQVTKGPLLRAMRQGLHALSLVARLVSDLTLRAATMRNAITPEMFATDRAIELARTGTPFRDAYRSVAGDLTAPGAHDIEASLAARVSPGATADLRLDVLRARLGTVKVMLENHTGREDSHAEAG
jgi:argininosuccinate lyase